MKKKRSYKGLRGVLILFFGGMCFLGIFFRLNNKPSKSSEDEKVNKQTAIEIALERNLSTNYPGTPKEVVKYFGEITKCFYNEEIKDDATLEALADQIRLLYDDELVAYKTREDYLFDLRSDIKFYNENGYKISLVAPASSTDVFYFSEDGYDWARIACVFTIKSGEYNKHVTDIFVLRKDDNSHWKIYGWDEEDG